MNAPKLETAVRESGVARGGVGAPVGDPGSDPAGAPYTDVLRRLAMLPLSLPEPTHISISTRPQQIDVYLLSWGGLRQWTEFFRGSTPKATTQDSKLGRLQKWTSAHHWKGWTYRFHFCEFVWMGERDAQ